jgi:hypothetical protein
MVASFPPVEGVRARARAPLQLSARGENTQKKFGFKKNVTFKLIAG